MPGEEQAGAVVVEQAGPLASRWRPRRLGDSSTGDVELSLDLLAALHRRWMVFLRGLMTLDRNVVLYAWHGQHHTAHVTSLRERMGW